MEILAVFCMIGVLGFLFFYLRSYIKFLMHKIDRLNSDLKTKEKYANHLHGRIRTLKSTIEFKDGSLDLKDIKISSLETELIFYKNLSYINKNGQTKINSDKDKIVIDEAIKKAMLYSHPDKGLCKDANDFIKFRELYNSRKRS